MIYIFCGLIALTVLLLTIFAKEDKNEKLENKSFNLKDILRVLKNYKIWLVSLAVMGVYMYQMELSILVSYLEISLAVAAGAIF
ncbi:hypothetical protein [Mycoplasma putrefaciens]|uniref:hypothetical protein n=1 Tax=Mycoplasma putrefaciens TaxID=2123 RepID=UPI0002E6AF81|nr:hypothetical protein [Mycoplasma putrefaciens]